MERVKRIELLSLAWKAKVIPLYDTRKTLQTTKQPNNCDQKY